MISTDLQNLKTAAVAAFDLAIARAIAWEQNARNDDPLCDALQGIKDVNNDENAAIDIIMGQVPCGQ